MFKIKDDKNLEELEKFGFKSMYYDEYYRYMDDCDYTWVDKHTRIIDFRYWQRGEYLSSYEPKTSISNRIIHKLKKAGFIENVIQVIDEHNLIKYIKQDL